MGQIRVCDNTSVGIIARDINGRILMVERRRYPFGFAPPSGHLDGYFYPAACLKEFKEETGLEVIGAPRPMPLIKNSKINNKCRRGGEYHFWQVFEVDCVGEIKPNPEETKWVGWMTPQEIWSLARKTYNYLRYLEGVSFFQDRVLVEELNQVIEKRWQEGPGLEVAWMNIFEELKII